MLSLIRIGCFDQVDILLKTELILHDIGSVRLSDIAVMPRFKADIGNVLLVIRIAQDDAVFGAVFINPGINTGAVILSAVEGEVNAVAGLMFAVAGLGHAVGILQTGCCKVFIIQLLLKLLGTVAGQHEEIVISGFCVEIIAHCDDGIREHIVHHQFAVTDAEALALNGDFLFIQADEIVFTCHTGKVVVDQNQRTVVDIRIGNLNTFISCGIGIFGWLRLHCGNSDIFRQFLRNFDTVGIDIPAAASGAGDQGKRKYEIQQTAYTAALVLIIAHGGSLRFFWCSQLCSEPQLFFSASGNCCSGLAEFFPLTCIIIPYNSEKRKTFFQTFLYHYRERS